MSHTPHNKGNAHNVSYIERQLRSGRTPEELGGVKIGEGVCKAAYRIGNFVIKENAQGGYDGVAQKLPPKCIRQYAARTYKAGNYILQEYAEPLRNIGYARLSPEVMRQWAEVNKHGLDTHAGNCGVTANGRFVVFDW